MRIVWAALAVLIALFGWSRRPPSTPKAAARPPVAATRPAGSGLNVLLITIDTLRADHLGTYGYRRNTSPRIDALAKEGAVFEQAYTYWPKTRGSFVMMMTGLRPSQNGYSKQHEVILEDNPTLAVTLKEAGYATAAVVDNANVAAMHGYGRGFDRYRETWTEIQETWEQDPAAEMKRTRLITEDAVAYLGKPPADRPFFLWLHYVNPHAPYLPPAPYDRQFLDASADSGAVLRAVKNSFHGGVHEPWEMPGRKLGYYVAQYDGEIAAVDQEVGKVLDALAAGPAAANTMVLVSSDHGESLGEHDYYFDHGADVFDPCLRVPLIVKLPGAPAGIRTAALASTLDFFPTILDAVKAPYPRDPRGFGFAGRSLLAEISGRPGPAPETLIAQNAHHWTARFDARIKAIAVPHEKQGWEFSLFDRGRDPGETRDLARAQPQDLKVPRRELELFFDREEQIWGQTRTRVAGRSGAQAPSAEECEQLRSLGYLGVPGCEKY